MRTCMQTCSTCIRMPSRKSRRDFTACTSVYCCDEPAVRSIDPSMIRGSNTDLFPSVSVTAVPFLFPQMIRIKNGILSIGYSGNLLRKKSGKISGFFYGKITRFISGFLYILYYRFFPDFFPYFFRNFFMEPFDINRRAVRGKMSRRDFPIFPYSFQRFLRIFSHGQIIKKSEGFPLRIFRK